MAFGGVVYNMKNFFYDKPVSDDWGVWAKEAIDRSGYFGIFSDANTMLDKATKGRFSATAYLSDQEMSRYYTRTLHGDIFGPTLSLVGDAATTTGMISDLIAGEKVNKSAIQAARRMVPYQNHIFLRNTLVDPIQRAAEERVAK